MAVKTITLKDLQSLQAAGKIVLKKVDNKIIDFNYIQEADSVNASQENSHTNGQQIKRKSNLTTAVQQEGFQDFKFTWTKQATFALLSAYEARNIETDNTKKNKRFWQAIATDLNELSLSDVPLTGDQVRWKFSALKKSYNKKRDHNRTSGNAPKIFDDFEEQLMDILGDKHGNINTENYFNSPILGHSVSQYNSVLNQSRIQNEVDAKELENVDMEQEKNSNRENIENAENINVEKRIIRKKRGTDSKMARTKLELEKQWLQHLQLTQEKYEDRKNNDEMERKRKIEELELKREKVHLKKKKILLEEQRLRQKTEQHREKMSIEKEKCDLLRSIIECRSRLF